MLRPGDLQDALAGHFSRAAQQPVHDVTDWTSLRAWLNNPLSSSLEADIYKCSNILRCASAARAAAWAAADAVGTAAACVVAYAMVGRAALSPRRHFVTCSNLAAERSIPTFLLRRAAGFAILSVLRVGCGWSAAVGTGLLVARLGDGSWSPPSAVGLAACGWGIQAGGELTDLLLVLDDVETVQARAIRSSFCLKCAAHGDRSSAASSYR